MILGKLIEHGVTVEIQSYLEIILMLYLDAGTLDDSDIENVISTCMSAPKLQNLDSEQIIAALFKAWDVIEKEGVDCRMIEVAKALKDIDQRIDAIGIAISIAASDGKLDPQERCLLEKLQCVLNLTDDNIVEAIQRCGTIPLLLLVSRKPIVGDSGVMPTLPKQYIGNDSLRTQAMSNDPFFQVEQRSIPYPRKRMRQQ